MTYPCLDFAARLLASWCWFALFRNGLLFSAAAADLGEGVRALRSFVLLCGCK